MNSTAFENVEIPLIIKANFVGELIFARTLTFPADRLNIFAGPVVFLNPAISNVCNINISIIILIQSPDPFRKEIIIIILIPDTQIFL